MDLGDAHADSSSGIAFVQASKHREERSAGMDAGKIDFRYFLLVKHQRRALIYFVGCSAGGEFCNFFCISPRISRPGRT
jgi:hypothetical protein